MPDQLKTHYCPACRITFRLDVPPRMWHGKHSLCPVPLKDGNICRQRMWNADIPGHKVAVGIHPADVPEGVA